MLCIKKLIPLIMPSIRPLTVSATHGPILFLFYFFQGQSGGSHEDGGLSSQHLFRMRSSGTEDRGCKCRDPFCNCNAWFWHLAYGLLPIYHTWWVCFCGDAGSQAWLCVQEQAKHQYLVFVDAMGVGYCMDIIDVNQLEHSPCSFSLLG